MKSNLLLLTIAVILSFLASSTLLAQVPSDDNDQCNEDFSRLLATQLVDESRGLTDSSKRIKVLIRSADFLWGIDTPTSRIYFEEAFKVASDRFREKGFEKNEIKSGAFTLTTAVLDNRFDVVAAIAKRDGGWARKLSDQLLEEFEKDIKNRKDEELRKEINSLISIALEIVDRDRDLSLYIYRRLMKYPLDSHWLWALYGLHAKDETMASGLYIELLQNYRNESPRRLLFLSAFPFGRDRMLGFDKWQYGTSVPKGFAARTDLQRPFFETFFNRVTRYAADPAERQVAADQHRQPEPVYMVTALAEMEPLVMELVPSLLQRYMEARSQAMALLTPEMQDGILKRQKLDEFYLLTFDERLEQLKKADEEGTLTDYMIVSVMTWLNLKEPQFTTLLPWLDKMKEKTTRDETGSYYWFARTKLAIKEERFGDAGKFSAKVPELEHQATLAFDLAEAKLTNVVDAASAYQDLNEVTKLARRMDDSPTKAKILLGLAYQYEKINHGFALEELSEAVRVINKLKDPDLFSSTVFRQIVGKNFAHYTSYSIPGYDPENTFRSLSKNDFTLTLSNAKSIEDRVLRAITVLAVAKNCVENTKHAKRRVTN